MNENFANEIDKSDSEASKTGLYEQTVHRLTEFVKPYLHKKTEDFIEKSVEKYAKNDQRFARMIEFEVKRRGDGAGITQDVSEPLVWIGIKTAAALGIAVLTESMKSTKLKMIGWAAALGIVLNNVVEVFRTIPRYVAGLQGSLEMAKERQKSIEITGVDPFDHGGRLIHKPKDDIVAKDNVVEQTSQADKKWAENEFVRKSSIVAKVR